MVSILSAFMRCNHLTGLGSKSMLEKLTSPTPPLPLKRTSSPAVHLGPSSKLSSRPNSNSSSYSDIYLLGHSPPNGQVLQEGTNHSKSPINQNAHLDRRQAVSMAVSLIQDLKVWQAMMCLRFHDKLVLGTIVGEEDG